MGSEVILFITAVVFLLLGYSFGRIHQSPEWVQEQVDRSAKRLRRMLPQEPSGAVLRPSAEELAEQEDEVLKGTNDAMRQSLEALGVTPR